ncbi:serine/threonine-protein kinase [Streptomyces meridianus]|uniref:non-specific serine/threonine protein kinase n=1 Tax=Streptomyces meridianus TaxID=2938945 RepID=A0ABT0X469_9ACTN|nr:serine/threonine-protein kinase [Streptomyces meridianus]MCM2577345.1 serine/threonine protein kinase [Streptomyces meridianus]
MLVADRYRLEAAIGRGGMGEVWRASDEVLGRRVAVKLLLGNDADEHAGARFRLEAQTAARLNHPHVVSVFDFGSWGDRFYLVMELVAGNSLAQEASGPAMSPQRVAVIAAQAAAGLAAAHRQGVVHRDIKPGNLMLDADGTLKIGDFGIARFVDDESAALTGVGQIVGTSLYLAPERALGRTAGPASDVYALGCVLYQLLAGRPPFEADTSTAVLYMHVDAAPTPLSRIRPELPGAFEEYLLRMLAKRPEDRPSAQEAADWFAGPAPYAVPGFGQRQGTGGRAAYTTHGPSAPPAPTVPPTTGRRRAVPQPQIHDRVRAHLREHKVLTGTVAGAGSFLAAAVIGMSWFGAVDGGPAAGDPSRLAEPAPSSSSAAETLEPSADPVVPAEAPAVVATPGHDDRGPADKPHKGKHRRPGGGHD